MGLVAVATRGRVVCTARDAAKGTPVQLCLETRFIIIRNSSMSQDVRHEGGAGVNILDVIHESARRGSV